MMGLPIKGFIETSFLDWDGKVVSTVFLPGCNFRCPFCHNAGLVQNPESYASVPLKQIEDFVGARRDFIDGICITGGEPSLQKEHGLLDFIRRFKQEGFGIKLDTNGTDPELLRQLLSEKLVDYVALDIKGPLTEKYSQIAGVPVDLARIRQSIELLMADATLYEFRTTVVPTLLNETDIQEIASSIRGAKKFVLQQFSPVNCWDPALREVKPFSREKLLEMEAAAKKFIPQAMLRGA